MTIDNIRGLLETIPLVVSPPVQPSYPERFLREHAETPVRWLPAASTARESLDDPRGWHQRALVTQAVSSGVSISQLAVENLSPEERRQTKEFTRHTLQRSETRVHPFALPADSYSWSPQTWSVLVKTDRRVVAHAGVLYRVITVGDLRVPVGGMVGVMTLPAWRGRGFARAALDMATAFVGLQLWARFALVICPRGDADFYDHLGWRVAEAPIWCEQPGGPVKLEGEVALFMPCQGDIEWPPGPIHLRGTPW